MRKIIGLIGLIAAYCVCSQVYAVEVSNNALTVLNFDDSAASQIAPRAEDRKQEAQLVFNMFQDAAKGGMNAVLRAYASARSWLVWLAGEENVKALETTAAEEGLSYVLTQCLVFYGAYYMLNSYLGYEGFMLTAGTAGAAWIVEKAFQASGAKAMLGGAVQRRLEERVMQIIR